MVSLSQISEMDEKKVLMLMENCRITLAKPSASPKQQEMAQDMMDLITESGRLYVDSENPVGLSPLDPICVEMREIVKDPDNVEKMVEVALEGKAPLGVVDPLLFEALESRYSKRYHATQTAGDFVAQVMKAKGFSKSGSCKLPEGSIAKTGSKFKKK